jgi:hypothetical protein
MLRFLCDQFCLNKPGLGIKQFKKKVRRQISKLNEQFYTAVMFKIDFRNASHGFTFKVGAIQQFAV